MERVWGSLLLMIGLMVGAVGCRAIAAYDPGDASTDVIGQQDGPDHGRALDAAMDVGVADGMPDASEDLVGSDGPGLSDVVTSGDGTGMASEGLMVPDAATTSGDGLRTTDGTAMPWTPVQLPFAEVTSLAVSANGNIVAGLVLEGWANVPCNKINASSTEVGAVLVLAPDGSCLRAEVFREGRSRVNAVTVNGTDIYATGSFKGTLEVGLQGVGRQATSDGPGDGFAVKLGPAGQVAWLSRVVLQGGLGAEAGQAILVRGANVYLSGYIDEGLSGRNDGPVCSGNCQLFVEKGTSSDGLDGDAPRILAKGSLTAGSAAGLAASADKLFVAGHIEGPSHADIYLPGNVGQASFITFRYLHSLGGSWTTTLASPNGGIALKRLAYDAVRGRLWAAGDFSGAIKGYPNASSLGDRDILLLDVSPAGGSITPRGGGKPGGHHTVSDLALGPQGHPLVAGHVEGPFYQGGLVSAFVLEADPGGISGPSLRIAPGAHIDRIDAIAVSGPTTYYGAQQSVLGHIIRVP